MQGGFGAWMALNSYMKDSSVKNQKLARGISRRILKYAAQFKFKIWLYLGFLVISSLLVVAQPLLFRTIVDSSIPAGNKSQVVIIALSIAGLALFDLTLGIISRRLQAEIGEGLIYNLRTEVFDHVQRQSIAFFTKAQTGALISRLNSDVLGAQRAFTSTLGGVVGNVITLAVVITTMLSLSWQITIASLLLLPVFLIPAKLIGKRLQKLSYDQANMNADISTQMAERFNVSGALLMKLFGNVKRENKDFADRAINVRDVGIRIAVANSVFFTVLILIGSLATAVVYGIGGVSVINASMTLGTLLALVALLGRLYVPLAGLANVRVDVMTALVSFQRVFEVLDLQPMVQDRVDAKVLERGPATLKFDHVNFKYPSADEVSLASLEGIARQDVTPADEPVLHDVSFEIQPGRMTALVGPSGAGKTTLTALVSRLYDPIDGVITLNNHDLRDVTQESLHNIVGVVTQDAHMYHDTIRANLTYANPEATDEQIMQACRDAQIAEMIEELPEGLDTVVGDRGYRLSGGEKQRLAIARLLLKAPDVVVLDEATAHLDSENEAAVQRALSVALQDRTSLVIAHRLSTIRQADEILVLEDGRIVQRGNHDQLVASGGLYADLYNRQFATSLDEGNSV